LHNMAPRTVLIIGATGQQGGAVVSALLDSPKSESTSLKIVALSRNPDSNRAKAIHAKHGAEKIEFVQGDMKKDPVGIFAALKAAGHAEGSIGAVFICTLPPHEDTQANPFIDAAIVYGVTHFVLSTVDRGGEPRSWSNPTGVQHFLEKHAIEVHMREAAARSLGGKKVAWTILRPVAFMENMNPGVLCSVFMSMWAVALRPEKKLQFVSTRDIGIWAARALQDPAKYEDKAIGLAGDEVTLSEAKDVFQRVVGKKPPQAWGIVGRLMLWLLTEVGMMFEFFDKEGYGVNIAALRKEQTDLLDLETWLRTESHWKDQIKKND